MLIKSIVFSFALLISATVMATPTLPEGDATAPVVLLVAPDDALQALARALAAQGVASVGDDGAGNLAARIVQLKKDARFNKVVVLGYGDALLPALLAANEVGANGFVALAANGERTQAGQDPAVEFGKLKMHARIIIGSADQQVSADAARKLEQGRPGTPVVVISGMNHQLQSSSSEQPVAPELVKALVEFAAKR